MEPEFGPGKYVRITDREGDDEFRAEVVAALGDWRWLAGCGSMWSVTSTA